MPEIAGAGELRDERLQRMREQLRLMDCSLSVEDYFLTLERMIEAARERIAAVDDPAVRGELRRLYREMIEDALALKLKAVLNETG